MAIVFDTTVASTTGTSPNTVNITPTSVVNNCVVIAVNVPSGSTSVALTYGGVSCTPVGSVATVGGADNYAYIITGTASGTKTISLSWSGGGQGSIAAANYTGVAQAGTTPDISNVSNGGTKTWSPNISTTIDNSWVVLSFGNSSGSVTAGANTTNRNAASNALLADTNAVVHPAGSLTMNETTSSASSAWAGIMFSIAPFSSAGGSFLLKMI